jgi:hypothetical protein
MRYVLPLIAALMTFGASLSFAPSDANAVACARGVYRAGCVGPRGAVATTRRPVAVAPVRRPVAVAPVRRCAIVNGVRVCR